MKRLWNSLVTRPCVGGRCGGNTPTTTAVIIIKEGKRLLGVVAGGGARMAGGGRAGSVAVASDIPQPVHPKIATPGAILSSSVTMFESTSVSPQKDVGFNSILSLRIEDLHMRRTDLLKRLHTPPRDFEAGGSIEMKTTAEDVVAFLRSHEAVLMGHAANLTGGVGGPSILIPQYCKSDSDFGEKLLFNTPLRDVLTESCNNVDVSANPPPTTAPMYRLMFHGSSNALSILNHHHQGGGGGSMGFQVPPPCAIDNNSSVTNSRPDTCYEGVYLTPSYATALSYAGLKSTTDSSSNAGVLVCAVKLGRIYNEFLEGPDTVLEKQLADIVSHRKALEKDGHTGGSVVSSLRDGDDVDDDEYDALTHSSLILKDLQFDTRMS